MRISLALAACIFLTGFAAQSAQAQAPSDIQMMPPTILGTNPAQNCPSTPGTGRVLTWDGQTPIACDSNVSVDQINNSVQVPVSSAAAGCDAAHAGSQRWNNVKTIMEFCNGTVWAPLGGNCDGLGYAAFLVSDPSGPHCAAACPGLSTAGTASVYNAVPYDLVGAVSACQNQPNGQPNWCPTIIDYGPYSFPNGKIGDIVPPNPSDFNGIGLANNGGANPGMTSIEMYFTCTASGWVQTVMAVGP